MRYDFEQVVACNMCRSTNFKLLGMRLSASQGLNPRKAEGLAVPIKQCLSCGLIFADPQPMPHDLSDHYGIPPDEYWGCEPTWAPGYFAREIKDAKDLIAFAPGMKALDIGAGTGLAMKSLSDAGFDTWGIEPSEPFRSRAIDKGTDSDRIQAVAIEAASFQPESFDFITFDSVLEHLFDPRRALEKALYWLRPGGVVHINVPSSGWFMPRLVNAYFRMRGTNYVTHLSPMHSPFHLYEFTLESFRDFTVVQHRFEVCEISHVPRLLQPALRWWMNRTDTGMQLALFLKRN
jgi:2-polyprenyl-3-methyl-5-hydroxy-6-metoxy-1,4-benzoquinol methylase